MRLHSYIVEHDMGFAPNPFHGICTLAACKPRIRKYAKLNEYVIGTGTKKRGLQGRLVYVMRISEISTFDKYWSDRRFARKKAIPNGSLVQRYGDNIYHRDSKTGCWIQEHSFHSRENGILDPDNLAVDTETTDQVLIGDWFIYWGSDAPPIPERFSHFLMKGVGNRYIDDDEQILDFLKWATSKGDPGVRGDPCEWKYFRKRKAPSRALVRVAA